MLSSSIKRAPLPVPGMIGLDQVAFEASDPSSRIVCSAIAKLLQAWGESVGGGTDLNRKVGRREISLRL